MKHFIALIPLTGAICSAYAQAPGYRLHIVGSESLSGGALPGVMNEDGRCLFWGGMGVPGYFVYTLESGLTHVGAQLGHSVLPYSQKGDIFVGSYVDDPNHFESDAIIGNVNGAIEVLPSGGWPQNTATDFNGTGYIVGIGAGMASNTSCIWNPDFSRQEFSSGWGSILNESGKSVANKYVFDVHDPSVRRVLQYPGGNPNLYEAVGLAESGIVLGSYQLNAQTSARSMVLWNDNDTIRTVLSQEFSPSDFNENLTVIGYSEHAAPDNTGLLWTPNGGVRSIKSQLLPEFSDWTGFSPISINNNGQILALAQKDGVYSTVFLEPVPEPATLAGLSLGLGIFARRKKKRTLVPPKI